MCHFKLLDTGNLHAWLGHGVAHTHTHKSILKTTQVLVIVTLKLVIDSEYPISELSRPNENTTLGEKHRDD